MNTALKILSTPAAFVLCASLAGAQNRQAIPGAVQDAGIYHVATGVWDRGRTTAAGFGPKVLYNNSNPTGFFAVMDAGTQLVDEGRLPGTQDPAWPLASADAYVIEGFQMAYCTSDGPGGFNLSIHFYQDYMPCTDPTLISPTASFPMTLPGSSVLGATACWLVYIDLTGGAEFLMNAEGEQVFDGVLDLDSFGWSFDTSLALTDFNGPLLAGSSSNSCVEGAGTYYYSGPPACPIGLGAQDQFWSSFLSGCLVGPLSQAWMVLYGSDQPELCNPYCVATNNSTGAPALITTTSCATASELTVGATSVNLSAAPVPSGQAGIFFHGGGQVQLPFGNGFLCANNGIVRSAVVVSAAQTAQVTMSLSGLSVGDVRNFQYWFRDPAAGGAFFNLSNALSIDFVDQL